MGILSKEGTVINQKSRVASKDIAEDAAIEAWLVSRLAELSSIDPKDIDVEKEFQFFGLSSLEAVLLIGDLEEWLGRPLDPMLIWDYPTIKSLSKYLASTDTIH